MVGEGRGSENGILFRGAEHLEKAQAVNTVVMDKTGTITRGEPSVTDVIPLGNLTEADLLQLAGRAKHGSEHPLGVAVVEGAQATAD